MNGVYGYRNVAVGCGGKNFDKNNDEIIIGLEQKHFNYKTIQIGHIDLIAMQKRLEILEEMVEKQRRLIEAMFYRPGMPGYEALEAQNIDIDVLEIPQI